MMSQRSKQARLKRTIGSPGMVFYGVGTMIGGGFYALLGKMVILSGVVSAATLCAATGAFLLDLTGAGAPLLIAVASYCAMLLARLAVEFDLY